MVYNTRVSRRSLCIFYTSILDGNSNNVGVFPYFIGEKYRSRFLSTNKSLNQTFDFNSSSLLRNTFPYKVSEKYADNDFIVESNELISQVTLVESLSKGPVENLKILSAGNNYKVGDSLVIETQDLVVDYLLMFPELKVKKLQISKPILLHLKIRYLLEKMLLP